MSAPRRRKSWRRLIPKPIREAAWRTLRWLRNQRPGLLMYSHHPPDVEDVPLPAGFALRPMAEGDKVAWFALLNDSGEFGRWDDQRRRYEARGLLLAASYVVGRADGLAAATVVLDRSLNGEPALELGWVVRDQRFRERGLGKAAFVAALRGAHAIADGRPVFLYTDDHRLTAIALYQECGLEPDLTAHRSYPARWEAVLRELHRRRDREDGR